MSLQQIGRELDVSADMLQAWAQQLNAGDAPPLSDVFSGQGRLPSDQGELRRLQRENHLLQQENSFLESAAADLTGQGNRGEEHVGRRAKAERLSRALIEFTRGAI